MIKPQQLHYAFIYLRHSGYRNAVIGIVQRGTGLLLRHTGATLRRTTVLRVAFYPVALAAEGKLQLHKGRRISIRILAAQHVGITHTATRLPVQGIGNGIKNYGFAGTGITGNQIQSLLSELGKSITVCPAYGPNALIISFSGLIIRHLPFPTAD